MFGNKTDSHQVTTTRAVDPTARGGIAFGPILTGVVVAFGAMFLLSAVIGGVLAALGLLDTNVTAGDVVEATLGAGLALVVAQFLAYMWGGYTAGRMARGSGVGNGLLVPVTAIVVALLVGGVATALGATANLNLPFTTNRLPLENDLLVDWGLGIGIASLVAMFLGGALGGGMGARWHTKLEAAHGEEIHTHTGTHGDARREVDLRDDRAVTPGNSSRTTPVEDGVDLSPAGSSTRTFHR